jgi:hypothetical protein
LSSRQLRIEIGPSRVQPAYDGRAVHGTQARDPLSISYIGRYDGRNWLPFWVDIGVVAVFSLAIFALAVSVRLHPDQALGYIEDLDPLATEPEADLADVTETSDSARSREHVTR